MRIHRLAKLLGFSLVLAACTGGGTATIAVAACVESVDPVESLCGRALEGPTGLLLVVRDRVVDIDANSQERIKGLPDDDGSESMSPSERPIGAKSVDGNAVISYFGVSGEVEVFVFRRESLEAVSIGFGSATPGLGGVWLTERVSDGNCRLSKVGLDGQSLSDAAPVDCGVSFVEETDLGLVGSREVDGVFSGVIADSENPSLILWNGGKIRGVFGSSVLHQAGGGSDFVLSDTLTGEEITIDLPVRVGQPGYGKLSPDDRYLAISFTDSRQVFDIWLLDTETLQWTRVPSMPVSAFVKASSFAWVPDGRLIILLTLETGGHQLATWTPGDNELEIRGLDFELYASVAVLCTSPKC